MAVLTRLLPRDWDGRRLLRFLAGLALLALAFTAPMAPAATAPAPAAASPVAEAPAAESSTVDSATEQVVPAGARSAMPSRECMHDGSGIPRIERLAGESAAPAGVTRGAHGSRGPPTA